MAIRKASGVSMSGSPAVATIVQMEAIARRVQPGELRNLQRGN